MGRGYLSENEISQLKKNRYVVDVDSSKIIYSNEFKRKFMDEYNSGKRPIDIFREAGFNPDILGTKRIERACARWREADKAGTLEKYSYTKITGKSTKEAVVGKKNEQLKKERAKFKEKLAKIWDVVDAKDAEIERLKREIGRLRTEIEDLKSAK